jgi:alpha-N-arabinofuranosidase
MRLRSLIVVFVLLAPAADLCAEESRKTGTAPITVTVDASKPGPPINPFIYGQFIEHLGRCIYGGIWAEMLEDRKFYYPISDDYHPYRDLSNTKYPVIAASPWQVIGPKGSVKMVTKGAFAGEHSPEIATGSAIRQNDLGLVADTRYVGHIRLSAPNSLRTVELSLSGSAPFTIKPTQNEFGVYTFDFRPRVSTERGEFKIQAVGAPVVVGAVSLMPSDNVRGFRQDTLELLKQLNATIYRWPGGNFVSGYNWRDGIGPRDRRPPRKNPAWTGIDSNDVGIDEFLDLCHEIVAEPMIAVNTGFGDAYSAAQEVEYANGSKETVGGEWRVGNLHIKPYDVKYWCVGNEMYGAWQLGHLPLNQYVQKHNLVAEAMHRVDPKLVLVGSCDIGTQDSISDGKKTRHVSWTEGMIERCGSNMDLVSEHFYCGRLPWTKTGNIPIADHVGLIRTEIRKKATSHRELQTRLGRKPENFIPIDMDEWNYWHRDYVYGELGCQYNLADALGIAAGLHEYFRNSDIIHAANYAQTVNVIGCIKTTKTAAFLDTTALPLLLYRNGFGTVPLEVKGIQSEKNLDVAAAKTEDGKTITIGVVNPQSEEQTIELKFDGAKVASKANVWRIAGSDPEAINTAEKQAVAIASEANVPFGDHITVPRYSVNLYRVSTN